MPRTLFSSTLCILLFCGTLLLSQEPVTRELSLAEAIKLALEQNPELQAEAYDLLAAEAQSQALSAERKPQLDFVAGAFYHLRDQRLLPASYNGDLGAFSDKMLAGDFVLSMPLYTGGRLSSQINASRLQRLASEKRLVYSREELLFNVISVFYQSLAQERMIESLKFSHQALEEHMKKIEEMLSVQKAAALDRLRVEVRVADLRQRLLQAENIMRVQNQVLANLLGLGEHLQTVKPSGCLQELPLPEEIPPCDYERCLQQRGDYQAAAAAVSAQEQILHSAKAGFMPTVALQASYGRRIALNSPQRAQSLDSNRENGWLGLSMQIPIISSGQLNAQVRREEARLQAAKARLQKLELQIKLEISTARLNINAAKQRLDALSKASEQAEESLRIEREKYELGKGSITEVLDAQTALLDSQTNYCGTLADLHVAKAQLKLAQGSK